LRFSGNFHASIGKPALSLLADVFEFTANALQVDGNFKQKRFATFKFYFPNYHEGAICI